MKRLVVLTIIICNWTFAQESDQIKYIRNHAELAVKEMHEYKIPASITLAQGIVESASGTSELAVNANNHFGIKCKGKEWDGNQYSKVSGEVYNGKRVDERSCFRAYHTVEEGYRDHSKFLAERPYYKSCFTNKIKDYKDFARCLKSSGYATDPKYASKLIDRIEKYNLQQFDGLESDLVAEKLTELYGIDPNKIPEEKEPIAVVEVKEPVKEVIPVEKEIVIEDREKHPNERIAKSPTSKKYVTLRKGETLTELSKIYSIKRSKLLKYNDLKDANAVKEGQRVYLEKKSSKGATRLYKVLEGESMYSIAQKTGIQLKKLYKRNRVKKGYEPKEGEILYLQGKRKK